MQIRNKGQNFLMGIQLRVKLGTFVRECNLAEERRNNGIGGALQPCVEKYDNAMLLLAKPKRENVQSLNGWRKSELFDQAGRIHK